MDTPHMITLAKKAHTLVTAKLAERAETLKSVDDAFVISRSIATLVDVLKRKFGEVTVEDKEELDTAVSKLAEDFQDLEDLRNEIRSFDPQFDLEDHPELPL
jgi:hypothetical protein